MKHVHVVHVPCRVRGENSWNGSRPQGGPVCFVDFCAPGGRSPAFMRRCGLCPRDRSQSETLAVA